MQIINSIICTIRGHRYPIKWTRDEMPNGEIFESGMADTYQPCTRCGHMSKQKFQDISKMFYNIRASIRNINEQLKK